MKNKWKMAFFILLGLLITSIALLFILVLSPSDKEPRKSESKVNGERVAFDIRTNREDVNKLVNFYLAKEVPDSSVDYRVDVKDEVELYGTVPFFSQRLDLKLTFEPEALENGDLLLKQKNMSVGRLPLPVPYVLEFIRKNYELPQGVEILSNDGQVYLHMQEIKLKSGATLKANSFDLKKDDISFTLLVPVQ